MTYQEWLITKANVYWSAGEPLPVDLYMEMINVGLDVDREEKLFHSMTNDD